MPVPDLSWDVIPAGCATLSLTAGLLALGSSSPKTAPFTGHVGWGVDFGSSPASPWGCRELWEVLWDLLCLPTAFHSCARPAAETAQDLRGNSQAPSPLEPPNLSGSSPSLPLPSKTRFPPLQVSSRGCTELLFQIKLRDTILAANNFNHSPLPFFHPKQGFLKI